MMWMDRPASAYVLHPLNCLVLDFEVCGRVLSVGIELKRTGGTSRKDWQTNANGFLRCQARGAPTPDLVISEFQR